MHHALHRAGCLAAGLLAAGLLTACSSEGGDAGVTSAGTTDVVEGPQPAESRKITLWFFPRNWYFRLPGDREATGPPETSTALEAKPPPPLEVRPDSWRNGGPFAIEGLRGRVVILQFWGTHRKASMNAMARNARIYNDYKDRGLVFIGIHDGTQGWDIIDEAIEAYEIEYPVCIDTETQATEKAYAVKLWPNNIIIDHNGFVRAAGLSNKFLEQAAELLVLEREAAIAGREIAPPVFDRRGRLERDGVSIEPPAAPPPPEGATQPSDDVPGLSPPPSVIPGG